MDVEERQPPKIVVSTEAIRAFQQVMLCLETEDGETHIFCVPPLRAKWLIAQIEGAIINPDA